MARKRRNAGRAKTNRGRVKAIACTNCARQVSKDKAVKRFTIRDIVDASSKRDIIQAKAFDSFEVPKLDSKNQYCISCAIHSRIVKVRSVEDRKNRAPPQRTFNAQKDKTVKA